MQSHYDTITIEIYHSFVAVAQTKDCTCKEVHSFN